MNWLDTVHVALLLYLMVAMVVTIHAIVIVTVTGMMTAVMIFIH